jgi:hypothetical protein
MTSKSHDILGPSGPRHAEVTPMFRVGDPQEVDEYFEGTNHVVAWHMSEVDRRVAPIAGWDRFPLSLDPRDSLAELHLPSDTRNASGVLGGVEAWPGEKRQLIEHLCSYVAKTKKEFGQIDLNVSADHIGVVQGAAGNRVFFAPPHRLSASQKDIDKWIDLTQKDLTEVLDGEPNLNELIAVFNERLIQDDVKEK